MDHQITLHGRLGSDPDMKYVGNDGKAVTNASIAVSKYKGRDASGKKIEETLWFRAVLWDKEAERFNEWMAKGDLVYIVGELEVPRIYTDRNGNPQVSQELTVRKFLRLSPPRQAVQNGTPAFVPTQVEEELEEEPELPF